MSKEFLKMVGLDKKNPESLINKHKPDQNLIFDPQNPVDIDHLKGTEKMRGILLNWCRSVLDNIFSKKVIIDSSFLIVKILFDYITFSLLNGYLNRQYIQLIGCVCLFISIKETYYILGMKAQIENLDFEVKLIKRLSYLTEDSYSPEEILQATNYVIGEITRIDNIKSEVKYDEDDEEDEDEQEESFLVSLQKTLKKYISTRNIQDVYTRNPEIYDNRNDKKWLSFIEEMDDEFMKAIRHPNFLSALRLPSFDINSRNDLKRMTHDELIEKINKDDIFSIMIECANEIMEQIVFNSFNHHLTKDPIKKEFAFACLLVAIQQQAAFDWMYEKDPRIPKHIASLIDTTPERLFKIEEFIIRLTGWKGCPNIETLVESKHHRESLLRIDDQIFQFGGKKMSAKKTKKTKKTKKKKSKTRKSLTKKTKIRKSKTKKSKTRRR